jgi:hypothetical protein
MCSDYYIYPIYIAHTNCFLSEALRNIYSVNKLEQTAAMCLLSAWHDLRLVVPAKLLRALNKQVRNRDILRTQAS